MSDADFREYVREDLPRRVTDVESLARTNQIGIAVFKERTDAIVKKLEAIDTRLEKSETERTEADEKNSERWNRMIVAVAVGALTLLGQLFFMYQNYVAVHR